MNPLHFAEEFLSPGDPLIAQWSINKRFNSNHAGEPSR